MRCRRLCLAATRAPACKRPDPAPRAAHTYTHILLLRSWCVTYKNGRSNGRHGCFGRVWFDDVQPTVVTRAEPHNLQLIHPQQDRVLTIRENARCQVRHARLLPLLLAS